MRSLTVNELLSVWESGHRRSPIERGLRLLSVACSEPDLAPLWRMSIGERDLRLLRLREMLFGSHLLNVDNCPCCSEPVEWESRIADLQLSELPDDSQPAVFQLEAEGYSVRYRLPNSEDIHRAIRYRDEPAGTSAILAACVLDWQPSSPAVSEERLPAHILDLLDSEMAKEDPQANISMLLNCPDCGHEWEMPFDISTYLWKEIDSWARRLLQEVYVLARAFHWSERDILNMDPHRRQLYLQMLRS